MTTHQYIAPYISLPPFPALFPENVTELVGSLKNNVHDGDSVNWSSVKYKFCFTRIAPPCLSAVLLYRINLPSTPM